LLLHNAPNLYEKNNIGLAVNRLDHLLWNDPHYQPEYDNALRGLSWGYLLQREFKHEPEAVKYFLRIVSADSTCSQAYYNLSDIYYRQNKIDSSLYFIKYANRMTPGNVQYLMVQSVMELKLGNLENALENVSDAIKYEPENIGIIRQMGLILLKLGRPDESAYYYRKMVELADNPLDKLLNLFMLHDIADQTDSINFYLNDALKLANKNEAIGIYSGMFLISIQQNNLPEARRFLNLIKQLNPRFAKIRDFETQLISLENKTN